MRTSNLLITSQTSDIISNWYRKNNRKQHLPIELENIIFQYSAPINEYELAADSNLRTGYYEIYNSKFEILWFDPAKNDLVFTDEKKIPPTTKNVFWELSKFYSQNQKNNFKCMFYLTGDYHKVLTSSPKEGPILTEEVDEEANKKKYNQQLFKVSIFEGSNEEFLNYYGCKISNYYDKNNMFDNTIVYLRFIGKRCPRNPNRNDRHENCKCPKPTPIKDLKCFKDHLEKVYDAAK